MDLDEPIRITDPQGLVRAVATGKAPNGETLTDDERNMGAALIAAHFRQQFGDDRELSPERVADVIKVAQEYIAEMDAGMTPEDILADSIRRMTDEPDDRLELTRWTGLAGHYQFVFDGESQHVAR